MNLKNTLLTTLIASALLGGTAASAATIDVTVVNITSGLHFTPLIIAAHNETDAQRIFRAGMPASEFPGLELMAEDGDISQLSTRLTTNGAIVAENPVVNGRTTNNTVIGFTTATNPGFLAPGGRTTVTLNTGTGHNWLSVGAMILPSNDGFVGVDSFRIPTQPGTYSVRMNVWDAGTEANREIRGRSTVGDPNGMPQPPFLVPPSGVTSPFALGTGGTGVFPAGSADPNTKIHIHRGNLGDFSQTAGISDMNARVHRWLNPSANLIITVR